MDRIFIVGIIFSVLIGIQYTRFTILMQKSRNIMASAFRARLIVASTLIIIFIITFPLNESMLQHENEIFYFLIFICSVMFIVSEFQFIKAYNQGANINIDNILEHDRLIKSLQSHNKQLNNETEENIYNIYDLCIKAPPEWKVYRNNKALAFIHTQDDVKAFIEIEINKTNNTKDL